ncbi:unnamed protein product [Protopolystoma xenopodis]|uniref:Uncharacterized protein n=1 Tax=Protopolystoma xenopodis TaxID=117903 RepID=A0A3S5AXL6_9PLAT|nr:unnamed protein product [Protopolystoma xenopodis]
MNVPSNGQLVKRNSPSSSSGLDYTLSSPNTFTRDGRNKLRNSVSMNIPSNRQLVKRNSPSSSGGLDHTLSSPNTFTRDGSKFNNDDIISDDVCRVAYESLASFYRNLRKIIQKQRQHECSSQSTAGQKEFAVVFWWNRPSILLTQHSLERQLGSTLMIYCSDDVRHMTYEILAPLYRNRRKFTRKQHQHECSIQSRADQDRFAVVFWWNRSSNLFTHLFHSRWKQA